jgi:hypothetical protein
MGMNTGWMQQRTYGTSEERNSVAEAGIEAGWEQKFGSDFTKFRESEAGFKWMLQQIKSARRQ